MKRWLLKRWLFLRLPCHLIRRIHQGSELRQSQAVGWSQYLHQPVQSARKLRKVEDAVVAVAVGLLGLVMHGLHRATLLRSVGEKSSFPPSTLVRQLLRP